MGTSLTDIRRCLVFKLLLVVLCLEEQVAVTFFFGDMFNLQFCVVHDCYQSSSLLNMDLVLQDNYYNSSNNSEIWRKIFRFQFIW